MSEETLFDNLSNNVDRPLSYRVRPQTFNDFCGQEHVIGDGKLLRTLIEKDRFQSLILWGPPGTGKNSLVSIIASTTHRHLVSINAVIATTKELKKIVEEAKFSLKTLQRKTLLFIDEIHRFNKAQQDLLLPYIEEGDLTLIGTTTHNPVFSIIPALRSRTQFFEFKSLTRKDISAILKNALNKEILNTKKEFKMEDEAIELILNRCGGDARIVI